MMKFKFELDIRKRSNFHTLHLGKNNQENEIHSVSREFVSIQLDSLAPFIKPTLCNVCQKLIHGDLSQSY